MPMNFEGIVRCNMCWTMFHESEIDYDEERGSELCPICGAEGCLMDLGDLFDEVGKK